MKRIVSVLLACLLLCGLTACGTETPQPTETQAITEPAVPEITTQVVEVMTDPDFDAEALFKRLEGVWNEGPGDAPPRGFRSFIYKDGKPSFYSGAYDGETAGVAVLTGGRKNEGGTVTLYFLYPAFDDVDGPVPERTTALQIDLTGIDGGELRAQEITIWMTYEWKTLTYRCKTLQEAGIRA